MNLWAILGPIILEIVRRLIDKRSGKQHAGVTADADEKSWCNEQADKLEAAVKQHKTHGVADASDGLIAQVIQLIALFRAGDLFGALKLAFEILGGSSTPPVTLPT